MERNINYMMIGGVFFALLIAMIVFILWIGRVGVDEGKYRTYYVYTDKEVSGIGVDTPVKYKGISIGSVKKVGFDKDKLGMVRISLIIDASIPVHKGSVLMVDSDGLAGLNYLSLQQGSNPEIITDKDSGDLNFEQNFMGKIASNADEVTKELLSVLKNLKELTSTQNIENISNIIKSFDSVAKELDETKESLATLSKNSNQLLLNINQKFESGQYDFRQMLSPVVMELEMSLKNMDTFFQKGSNLLDKFDSDPYNTLFGEKK